MQNVKPHDTNPYFGKGERFRHVQPGLYLVTRLDGYTLADCLRFVDAALAAKTLKGPFLIHVGPGHEEPGFKMVNDGMRRAHETLVHTGFQCTLSPGPKFATGTGLMGYFSWGS